MSKLDSRQTTIEMSLAKAYSTELCSNQLSFCFGFRAIVGVYWFFVSYCCAKLT